MVAAYSDENTDAEEVIKSLFPDVLWPDDLGDVFLDIAAVFVADTPGCPTTGLWLKSQAQDRIPHRGIIQQFFGPSLRLGSYTFNPFGHFKSVAGFKYVANNINEGDGALGVRKLQAYHTIKTQFEYRGSSWRHNLGTTVQPSDVWKNSKRFKKVAKTFQQSCADASMMTFGARLEFRVSFTDAVANRSSYLSIVRNVPILGENLHFQDTGSLLQFFANRYSSAILVCDNLSHQLSKREAFDRMTAAIFLTRIINTITSTANQAEEFASEVAEKLAADLREESDLMFWRSVIVATEDGKVTSAFAATENAIKKIFGVDIINFNQRHQLANLFEESASMEPILDQQLDNDVVRFSHIEESTETADITATQLTIPRAFERMVLLDNAVFRMPSLPTDINLNLNVQLILSIFTREGLTPTAATSFLEVWAQEHWRCMPDLNCRLQSHVDIDSLKLEHFSSLEMLQSVMQ
ncbi:hypothetical protein, partial, partial [Absidia glauca]